jgi:hypothetical protein
MQPLLIAVASPGAIPHSPAGYLQGLPVKLNSCREHGKEKFFGYLRVLIQQQNPRISMLDGILHGTVVCARDTEINLRMSIQENNR